MGKGAAAEEAAAAAAKAHGHSHGHGCGQRGLRRVARTLVDYPCGVASATLFVIVIMIAILGQFTIVIDTGGNSFRAETDSTAKNFDALTVATMDVISPPRLATDVQPERALAYGSVSLIYEPEEEGSSLSMFSLKALKEICEMEKSITGTTDYQKFCLRGEDGSTCAAPVSVMSLLFPLDGTTGLPVYDCAGLTQADVDGLMPKLDTNPTSTIVNNTGQTEPVNAGYFLPTGFGPGKTSAVTRSLVMFGLPLAGYNNTDQPDPSLKGAPSMRASTEQVKKFDTWALDNFLPKLEEASTGDVAVRFRGTTINDELFTRIMLDDVNFAMGSLVFVFLYCWFHMRSLWYTATGLFGVLLSFPVALFLYRVVLGIEKMGTLNFLGLFIILGIGADDMFLLRDAYIQVGAAITAAKAKGGPTAAALETEHAKKYARMEAAYARSATAMFITTMTTSLSFAGNIVSIIPPVREFGIFTSVLTIANYAIILTLFPSFMMLWERISARCGRTRSTEGSAGAATGDTEAGIELPAKSGSSSAAANAPDTATGDGESAAGRLLERYFAGTHTDVVHKFRYPILAVFAVFLILCTIAAFQVQTAEEAAAFLPDDHPFWRSVTLRAEFEQPSKAINDGNGGGTTPATVEFEVAFGVKGINRDNIDATDASDLGEVVWDDAWDITDPAAQQSMLDLCDNMEKDLPNVVTRMSSCFLRPWKTWLVDTKGLTFPLSAEDSPNAVALLKEWFNAQGPPHSNPYFLNLGFERGATLKIKFAKVVALMPIKPFTPATTVEPMYDEVVAFIDKHNAEGAASANAIMSSFWFMIMRTESVLVETAILCASVSVALAFVLLLVSSRNLIIAAVSTFCILSIVAIVIAFMWAAGWDLGIVESICLTVLVGISVDYTVHLAVAYGLHSHGKRLARMRMALEHMGISVFSAAITTIGSAAFLTLAVVLFFNRFGVFICISLAASVLVAFVVFPALMFVIGPENEAPKPSAKQTATEDDAVDAVIEASMGDEV